DACRGGEGRDGRPGGLSGGRLGRDSLPFSMDIDSVLQSTFHVRKISTVGCEAAAKLPPAETETTETERKDEHRPPVARESLSTASPQSPVAAESDGCCTAARSRRDPGPDAPPLRAADQPVLPQGPARELRQARADADA